MSKPSDALLDFITQPREFVAVYEIPERMTNGYCFHGGVPVVFTNLDWFECPVTTTRDEFMKQIKQRRYAQSRPHARLLVLCRSGNPDFTFTIEPDVKIGLQIEDDDPQSMIEGEEDFRNKEGE